MAHTPGPWRFTDRRPVTGNWASRIPFAIETAIGPAVAPIADVCDQPQAEANARLIAAAPELLEALKLCAGFVEAYMRTETRAIVRAAIAKAESKSV